jgi:hypothetical protein
MFGVNSAKLKRKRQSSNKVQTLLWVILVTLILFAQHVVQVHKCREVPG